MTRTVIVQLMKSDKYITGEDMRLALVRDFLAECSDTALTNISYYMPEWKDKKAIVHMWDSFERTCLDKEVEIHLHMLCEQASILGSVQQMSEFPI